MDSARQWLDRVSSRVTERFNNRFRSGSANNTEMETNSTADLVSNEYLNESEAYTPSRTFTASTSSQSQHTYTELMGGSVPCPSCRGAGRIPNELESQLVALIPVNDERLKPRRTWLYVLIGVLVVISIFGLISFFMVPRSIDLSGLSSRSIEEVVILKYEPRRQLKLNFWNRVLVNNANYYSVKVTNASNIIVNRFQPWMSDRIGTGLNESGVSISGRSSGSVLLLNNTVVITKETLKYCESEWSDFFPLYVLMELDVTVTFQYFGHREQDTLTLQRQVCCVPSGNCSATAYHDSPFE